jgi:O-antigen ligase
MPRKKSAGVPQGLSRAELIAWYALLVVPVAVPTAVAKVPFAQDASFTYNLYVYPKLFALGWLVGISLLAWGIGVATGTIEARTVPLQWWLIAFLGLALASTSFALSPTTAFFGGRYYAVGMLVLLLSGALFFLITQLVTTTWRVRAFSWATVVGGAIVAGVGLLQVFGVDPLGPGTDPAFMTARGMSLLGNPDFSGTFLIMPAVLAAALLLSEHESRLRAAALFAFLLTTASLVTTLTRAAWIGLALGLLVLMVALIRSGTRWARPLYIALGATTALVLPLLLILRDPTRALRQVADLATGGTAGSGRLILWKEALEVIARHPLLGTGPDSYRLGWYVVRSVESVRLSGIATVTEDPHNVVLLLAATVGIPAAFAAAGFIGASLYTSAQSAFARHGSADRLLYGGWWAALLALCAALILSANTIPVVVALLSAAGILMAARSRPASWPTWVRYILCGSAAVIAVVALCVATLTIWSDATLMHAQTVPDRVPLAGKAAMLAPWNAVAREQAVFGSVEAAMRTIQSGRPEAPTEAALVEQQLNALIAENPYEYRNRIELAYFLGQSASVLGDDAFRRAIEAANGALEVCPVSPEAAYLKATAQTSLGNPGEAVRTLDGVWDDDPSSPYAGVVFAEALLLSGDQSKAAAVVRTLVDRFPTDQNVLKIADRVRNAGAN